MPESRTIGSNALFLRGGNSFPVLLTGFVEPASSYVRKHVKFMKNEQGIEWYQTVYHVAYRNIFVDAEIEMQYEDEQCHPCDGHFYHGKQLNILLDQIIH